MQDNEPFLDTLMPSLIWNTNPTQMMSIVVIMMKMAEEMDEYTDWDDYWKRVGFIKE
jgi:hypothetical protein